jgi:hypothetical protein
MKASALLGAASIAVLTAGPAVAAGTESHSTAQSINLQIGGNAVIAQLLKADYPGGVQDKDSIPKLATLIQGNNALGDGVAPERVHAGSDGTSYACAGLTGTGGGIAQVGNTSCNISGKSLTLNLGTLNLDLTHLLGDGEISGALRDALAPLLTQLGPALDQVVAQITNGIKGTPLGQISLTGGVSVIEGVCTADPKAARGDADIADTNGNGTIPISVTLPDGSGGTQNVVLANVDVSMEPRPGGYDVLVNLDKVTQALIDAIHLQLDTMIQGQLAAIGDPLTKQLLQPLQDQVVEALVTQLKPVLQQLSDNLLKLTILNRTYGDGGKSVDVTALDAQVLPAAKQFAGFALVQGTIGHVTCGPNARAAAPEPPHQNAHPPHQAPHTPNIPKHVDSGLASYNGGSDVSAWIAAIAALLAIGGGAGTLAYRRYLMPRG